MDIFHRHLRVIRRNIIVAEIPKAFNAKFYQFIGNFFCAFTWDTKYGNRRFVVFAKIIQPVNMSNGDIAHHLTGERLVFVKNSNQVKSALFKGHMRGDSSAEITGAD